MVERVQVKELLPSAFEQFKSALATFVDDLNLVHGPGLQKSPFEEPAPYNTYSLTQIPNYMKEGDFYAQLEEVEQVVVSCMDKRAAHSVWEQTDIGKGKTLFLSVAGGPVQNKKRLAAMEKIAYFLAAFDNIKKVVLIGNEHLCGAVQHFLGDKRKIMKRLIADGAGIWIDAFGDDKVFAKLAVINEAGQTVRLEEVDVKKSKIKPLSIESLL